MPAPLPEQPDALAYLAARGDSKAFTELVRSTRGDVWRFIAHMTDPSSADDLSQETYLRAWRSIRRFESRSSVTTWLLSIARRVVMDDLRRAYRRPSTAVLHEDEGSANPAQQTGFQDIVELRVLLSQLDERRRTALILTQVIGLSYSEAAEVCRVPVGTIRSRVARARQDLITLGEL